MKFFFIDVFPKFYFIRHPKDLFYVLKKIGNITVRIFRVVPHYNPTYTRLVYLVYLPYREGSGERCWPGLSSVSTRYLGYNYVGGWPNWECVYTDTEPNPERCRKGTFLRSVR